MSVVVQKYGGTSVATPEQIRAVAARVVATRKLGHSVVVVVSAMGNTTNELIALARSVSSTPHRRELDMLVTVGERISMALLSMAIHDLGHPAVSFTGSQSGIITTDAHTNARVIRVTPVRIRNALSQGQTVIVAGFQGVSERLEITSLGRGGSDTTAIALAAALDAEYAEICSDVDGVYTADPRVVPEARRLDSLSHTEMQALADAGARVLNAEAVEWARRQGIEIRCVATQNPRAPGTRITASGGSARGRVIAVTARENLVYVEPQSDGAPPPRDLATTLAAHGASQAQVWILPSGWAAAVPRENIHGWSAFTQALDELGDVRTRTDLALVTVVGRALAAPPAVFPVASEALAARHIQTYGRLIDAARLSYLVDTANAAGAVKTLHAALIAGPETTKSKI